MARGSLRIYLGAAPGVGKTYDMLNEGRRRRERGTDVVVGFVETHGRLRTARQIGDLEVIPRRRIEYRGTTFDEMDIDALLARHPRVALVDELAHTNVPGSRNAKRWQDIDELLGAGIDVISTVNIQHLESINDVVERITGVVQRETVPDYVVRSAEQVEVVDQTPEALRRRMAHGNIYGPEKIDAALTNYFRPGNLAALRELALLWVADQVDTALEDYRERHGITDQWETRERVVVAVTGAPGSENLIRRAGRIARRTHGELIGVHVRSQEGLAGPPDALLADHRRLLEEVGGQYHETAASDIAAALVEFARSENATQIVLGASRRSRLSELFSGSVINRVVRLSGPIDIHVISPEPVETSGPAGGRLRAVRRVDLSSRRRRMGWVVATLGLPLLTLALANLRGEVNLPGVLLLYLLLVVATAVVGGYPPALAAAVGGFLLANWYFTPPIHRWTIDEGENVLALVVYLVVAGIVSSLVAVAARRTAEASRATAEAETLASLAGGLVDIDPIPILVSQLRRAFGLDGVALLRRDGSVWRLEASDGIAPTSPEAADEAADLSEDLVLALSGPNLGAEDRRVLRAFGAHLAAALERRRLSEQAAEATALAESNELRSALLQAVSHDLRTPLASIKASINSLRQPDITWSKEEAEEFQATIEDETDRMTNLVVNLLDMSRIQAGALAPELTDVGLDEVVPAALDSLGPRASGVDSHVPEDLPAVRADPALLERVVANLVDNAISHSTTGTAVRVEAGCVAGRVLLRVIDQGPGIPPAHRVRVFEPFQRLGDNRPRNGTGLGLGLPVALGFVTAIGADLHIEDTPGGGTTMVISLRAVA